MALHRHVQRTTATPVGIAVGTSKRSICRYHGFGWWLGVLSLEYLHVMHVVFPAAANEGPPGLLPWDRCEAKRRAGGPGRWPARSGTPHRRLRSCPAFSSAPPNPHARVGSGPRPLRTHCGDQRWPAMAARYSRLFPRRNPRLPDPGQAQREAPPVLAC